MEHDFRFRGRDHGADPIGVAQIGHVPGLPGRHVLADVPAHRVHHRAEPGQPSY
jgi:hypothetical protein